MSVLVLVGWEVFGRAGMLPRYLSAPNMILRIDIVKDGKYVFTTQSHGRTASLRFQDTDVKAGKSYYYIRVFQTDTENPTGDPEVGWTSPWFVSYQ